MTTLLLVDDHPLFCDGFAVMARTLKSDWTVRFAASAAAACEVLESHAAIDLVLIDINLPDRDGFALAREICQRWPATPRLLISGREDAAARIRARSVGVSGFIAKSATPWQVADCIQTVLDGGAAFDRAPQSDLPQLSPRQAQVLELLGEGHSNTEIERRLNIAERTVRAHLTDLFQLLGAPNRGKAVLRARELGLIA